MSAPEAALACPSGAFNESLQKHKAAGERVRQAQAEYVAQRAALSRLVIERADALHRVLEAFPEIDTAEEEFGELRRLSIRDTLEFCELESGYLLVSYDRRGEYSYSIRLPQALLGDDWQDQLSAMVDALRQKQAAQAAAKAAEEASRELAELARLQQKYSQPPSAP